MRQPTAMYHSCFLTHLGLSQYSHSTSMSPLVFLLTPLVPRIVSFDYPPVVVQHTVSSYTSKRYHLLSKPGQITAMPHHQKRLNHDLTTYLQQPLFQSNSICYILILPEARTFNFWKGPLRRRAGELPGSGPFCWSLRTTVLLSFFYLLSSSTLVPKPHRAGCQILAKLI